MGHQVVLFFFGSSLFAIVIGQLNQNAQGQQSYHRGQSQRPHEHYQPKAHSYAQLETHAQKRQDQTAPTWTDFVAQSPVSPFGSEDGYFQFKDITAGTDDLFNQIQLGPQQTHDLLQNSQQAAYSITPLLNVSPQPPLPSQQNPNRQAPFHVTVERNKETELPQSSSQHQHPNVQVPPPPQTPPTHYIQAAFVNPLEQQVHLSPQTPVVTPAIQIIGPGGQPLTQAGPPPSALSPNGPPPPPNGPTSLPSPSDAEYAEFAEYQKHFEAYNRYQDALQSHMQGHSSTGGQYSQKPLIAHPYKNSNGKPRGPKSLPFPYNMMANVFDSFRTPTKGSPYGTKTTQLTHKYTPFDPVSTSGSAQQFPSNGGFSSSSIPHSHPTQGQGNGIYSPFPSAQTPTQGGSIPYSPSQPLSNNPAYSSTQTQSGSHSYLTNGAQNYGQTQSGSSYSPQQGQGPSYPQQQQQKFVPYQPQSTGPSYQPQSTGSSYQPQSTGPSYQPQSTGPSYQPQSTGPSYQPQSVGPSYPPQSTGPSYQQHSSSPPYAPSTFNELPQSPLPSYAFTGNSPKFPSQYSPGPSPSTYTVTQTELLNGKPVTQGNYPTFHSDVMGYRPGPGGQPKQSTSYISQWQQGVLSMAKDLLGSWIKPSSSLHIRNKRNFGPNEPFMRISTPENAMDDLLEDRDEKESDKKE